MMRWASPAAWRLSLRSYLLWGILVPVGLFIVLDSVVVYRQALSAVNTAYDRTLLASAKAIGEHISADGEADAATLSAKVPYAALEVFEADNRSRMIYRISNMAGALVDGFEDLTAWHGTLPVQGPYAALADFYDGSYRGDAVRVAVLLQPVAVNSARTMAVIQVAETLELRRTLARQILLDTLWRQLALISVVALVVVVVVQRATRPVRQISRHLQARREDDLTPLSADDAPLELQPLLEATNTTMRRLQHLLDNQKRFVRDAAHQLRTPLAVLKVQVQSALRGDVATEQGLIEINHTVERATTLANQMLSLAKVAQLSHEPTHHQVDWDVVLREVALDLAPLMAERELDFDIETTPAPVHTHDWMLRELSRNLLHNAIHFCPPRGKLVVRLRSDVKSAALTISDSGPGISVELSKRLFQPFSSGVGHAGSGLGLAICHEITQALNGQIEMRNRVVGDLIIGCDASVSLPLDQPS
jgi:two-component system sensor histidine kinase TctE